MPPLVSIIIPTYNYAHYLVHAIESALAQTHPNIEVIVIDDGSTDHTAEVVKPFHDRIQYRYKENGGLSAARNTGIQAATGDYLVFLDADDLLDSNVIEKSLKTLTQHPSAPGCVCQNEQFVEVPGDYSKRFGWHLPDTPDLDVLMLFRNIAPPHAYMIQKEKAMQMTFDTELKACEDYDYWFRYFSTFGAPVRSDGLVYYRRHSTSMSANREKQTIYDCNVQLRICSALFDAYKNNGTLFTKQINTPQMTRYCIPALASCLLNQRNLRKYAKKSDQKPSQSFEILLAFFQKRDLLLTADATQFLFNYYIAKYSFDKTRVLKKIFKMPLFSLCHTQRRNYSISFASAIKTDLQWHLKGLFRR